MGIKRLRHESDPEWACPVHGPMQRTIAETSDGDRLAEIGCATCGCRPIDFLKVVRVPVLDTGIGREAGYENDEALMEAARREREALPPEVRELAEALDAKLERRFLYGDSD